MEESAVSKLKAHPLRADVARASAQAAVCGYLPHLLVDAWFMASSGKRLGVMDRAWFHTYEVGQTLALGVASAALAGIVSLLPTRFRAPVAMILAFTFCQPLVAQDLQSFVERHADSRVPFVALTALGSASAIVVAHWLSARLAGRWLGVGALVLGMSAGIASHLVLPLAYPGAHLLLVVASAALMGSVVDAALCCVMSPRKLTVALACAAVPALASVLVPPRSVVRAALLHSTSAVAAPYVAMVWASRIDAAPPVEITSRHPEWWRSRVGTANVAPHAWSEKPKAPIFVLITFDAVRADVVEAKQNAERLPHWKKLRSQSLRFDRAWSPAPATRQSLTALFLGTYYSQQRWLQQERAVPGEKKRPAVPAPGQGPHFPALLERAGVRTTHFCTHGALRQGLGIGEGFGREVGMAGAYSEAVVSAILQHLERSPDGPQFLYAHVMDAHAPYTRGSARGSDKERYVGEIAVIDAALGELMRGFRAQGLDDRLLLAVSADHGEAFGEHGYRFHAQTVYEEMIGVPLYIWGPNVKARRIRQAVSLIDLGPTILDLFGLPTPGHYMGQSLVPFLAGDTPVLGRPIAADSRSNWRARALLVDGHLKAVEEVRAGTEEVYDLNTDPDEKINLADSAKGQQALAALRGFFRVHAVEED